MKVLIWKMKQNPAALIQMNGRVLPGIQCQQDIDQPECHNPAILFFGAARVRIKSGLNISDPEFLSEKVKEPLFCLVAQAFTHNMVFFWGDFYARPPVLNN